MMRLSVLAPLAVLALAACGSPEASTPPPSEPEPETTASASAVPAISRRSVCEPAPAYTPLLDHTPDPDPNVVDEHDISRAQYALIDQMTRYSACWEGVAHEIIALGGDAETAATQADARCWGARDYARYLMEREISISEEAGQPVSAQARQENAAWLRGDHDNHEEILEAFLLCRASGRLALP